MLLPGVLPRAAYNEECDPDHEAVDRDHSRFGFLFIAISLSLCITVDILQYSMPLAFLPSVLEDRGHRPLEIASAIGIYYWMGFLGGLIITGYQFWRLLTGKSQIEGTTTVGVAKRQIKYLIVGLGIGAVSLLGQALSPNLFMHTFCRCIQGLCGAFIFFYTFLLSMNLFKDDQQVFAMTLASTALNVAEVLGGFFGAAVFDAWGQSAVFILLAVMSIANQVLLVGALYMIQGSGYRPVVCTNFGEVPRTLRAKFMKIKTLFSCRFSSSMLLISTAALIKAAIEEMLPFHADHEWHMNPMEIGWLFSVIAVSYIIAAAAAGKLWAVLINQRTAFAACWLILLGVFAWASFLVASLDKSKALLATALVIYGVCLGFTHTPAALLLSDAIEDKEGTEKDACNGMWNTTWEAGGSLGFLLGGLLAHNYAGQLNLLAAFAVVCVVVAILMVLMAGWTPSVPMDSPRKSEKVKRASGGYGALG